MGQLQGELDFFDEILSGKIDRKVLLTVHQQVKHRIFDKGQDAKGQLIGKYSEGYLKRRKKKGLGSSKKVVLEFTGQMRNDWQLIESNNKFGSGFLNSKNFDKSEWTENTYKKEIFDLSTQERKLIEELYDQEINKISG